ncbi:MAG TPA: OB-fold domain-containing protein [Frankiaceae bacterium]|jgi:hypothetical protein|nr:OB-fold domain-containing protein [Frankiaceae bacterium]
MTERPLPQADLDSVDWWDALARHEFTLQRCTSCRTWRWPARALCNRCHSFEWTWEAASGEGEIASWVVTHHAFLPGFAAPYAVLTVRLAEQDDLLLPGSFAGAPDDPGLGVGARVRVGFDDLLDAEPTRALLCWTLEGTP